MIRKTHTRRSALLRCLSPLAAGLILLTLAGCGPIEVRSAPPGSDLDGVTIEDDALVLRVLVINRNDIPIRVEGVELDVVLGGEDLGSHEWELALGLAARNRDAIELRLPASRSILDELEALERGEREPLAYALNGRWLLVGSRDGRIERNGYLHPVPGRSGRFR
jgi:hypothetical protein